MAILLLTGCAHYRAQPLSPEQSAAEFEGRSLADEGLKGFLQAHEEEVLPTWPLAEWDFERLTLAALYYQPDLDAARAQWATLRGGEITAGQRPNPTVGVAPGYNATTSVPTPWFVNFTVDIPIETAGKRGYRIAQAQHLSEAARLNVAAVAWEVRGRLRRSLVDVWEAGELTELGRRQSDTLEHLARLMEARFTAGAASSFEVTQARLAWDRSLLALHDAEVRKAEASAQLAAAIGVPASSLQGTVLDYRGLNEVPVDLPRAELRQQALLSRADILGALARYAASEAALHLEVAKQYPDARLSPGYKYDQGDNEWSLGLSVDLPILNQNQGAIAEAEGRRAETAAMFRSLQAKVVAELDRSGGVYDAARAKVVTAERLLRSQRSQHEKAAARFQAGDSSRLDLTLVELELAQVMVARMKAVAEAQRAFGDLETALQSPWVPLSSSRIETDPAQISLNDPEHE